MECRFQTGQLKASLVWLGSICRACPCWSFSKHPAEMGDPPRGNWSYARYFIHLGIRNGVSIRGRPRFRPPEHSAFCVPRELAHVDASRSRNLRKNRTKLKASCNNSLLVLARPAPTALGRRDHFTRILRHSTTPSVCTRTSEVTGNLARRSSLEAYETAVFSQLEISEA